MQLVLEYLTKALIYLSVASIVIPMFTPILFSMDKLIDKDSIKPNAPKILLGSMAGGLIVLIITSVLIKKGILPYIFV